MIFLEREKMKVHHIGYLIKNIDKSIEEFRRLGFDLMGEVKEDLERKIKIAFIKNCNYQVELIQPIDTESSYWALLKKYKNVAYHICYQVKDIEDAILELKNNPELFTGQYLN